MHEDEYKEEEQKQNIDEKKPKDKNSFPDSEGAEKG